MNQYAISLIKSFEGCKLNAYLCPANICTIGWGHTGADVKLGDVITQLQADELLVKDLSVFERAVVQLVGVPLSERKLGALISLTYNIGILNFKSSTLLNLIHQGEFDKASNEFARWNKIKGKVSIGLSRRRKAECDLFSQA